MPVNFEEELIRVEYVIGEDTITEAVSGQVTVPEEKPDIERVIDVTANLINYTVEVEEGGVNIEGRIQPGIIYVADIETQPVHFFGDNEETVVTFTNFVDIPEAEEGMNAFVDINIRRVSYELIGPRTVEVTVVITKFAKVTEYRQITVITEVTGIPEEDIFDQLLKIEEVIGERTTTATVTGRVDRADIPENKPPISRVLNVTADLINVTPEMQEESVVLDGTVNVGVIYVADVAEQPVHYLEGQFDFTQVVNIPGVFPGMTPFVQARIRRVSFTRIDEDVVEVSVVMEFFAKVTEPRQVRVITDIISDEIEVERELLRVENVVGEDTEYATISGNLNVPAEKPSIERVLEVTGRVVDFEAMTEDDGVMIEGQLLGEVLYVADIDDLPDQEFAQPVHYFEGTINFENFVRIPGAQANMQHYVAVNMQRVSFNVLNSRTVEFTAILRKFAKVTEFVQKEIITDVIVIAPVVDDECPPSYVIYVIQPGDTLWKIARRYRTTVEKLIKANPGIDPANLRVGQKICVPKKIIDPKG